MVSAVGRDEDTTMQFQGEPDLNKMAQWVQNLFKFKNLYDQMDFHLEQRLAIMKAIIELTDPPRNSNLVESR